MSNSFVQALLMDAPEGDTPPPGPPTCIADPYYSCGPDCDPYWNSVVLQLHMDAAFTDTSLTGRTITTFASAAIDTSVKKFGAGSGYFPSGTTSYITTGAGYNFSGDFTIEFWMRPLDVTRAGQILFALAFVSGTEHFYIVQINNGVSASIGLRIGVDTINNPVYDIVNNTWHHIAVVRSSGTITLYKNGVATTPTTTTTFSPSNTRIGQIGYEAGTGNSYYGYIDDFRVTTGVARYTGNFNIPTEAFPDCLEPGCSSYWNNVVLQTHFDGANGSTTFIDSSRYARTLITYNSPTISTAQSRFGGASLLIDSTENVIANYSPEFDFGSGDFTIEAWIHPTALPTSGDYYGIISRRTSYSAQLWNMHLNGDLSGALVFELGGSGGAPFTTVVAGIPIVGAWSHVAAVRSNGFLRLYLNGVGTTPVSLAGQSFATFMSSVSMAIGTISGSTFPFNGYIDECRVTVGFAHYTDNFSVPTEAFPDCLEQRTVLSLHAEPTAVVSTADSFDPNAVSLQPTMLLSNGNKTATSNTTNTVSAVTSRSRRHGKYYWEAKSTSIVSTNWIGWVSRAVAESGTWDNSISGAVAGGFLINPSDSAPNTGLSIRGTTVASFAGGNSGDTFSFALDLTGPSAKIAVALNGVWQFGDNPSTNSITYSGSILPGYPAVSLSGVGSSTTIALSGDEFLYPIPTGYSAWATTEDGTNNEFPTDDSSCYQPKTVTLTGSASVSTTEKKFGASSFLVPNTGSPTFNGVVINDHQDFDFGVQDFTIELWTYRSSNTYTGYLYYFTMGGEFSFVVGTDGLIYLTYYSSGGAQTALNVATFPLLQWNFVVVQRRGTNWETYLNGSLINTLTITGGAASTVNSSGTHYLGRTNTSAATTWNGYIDEVRVTKGVARYPVAFDPETLPNCDSTTAGESPTINGEDFPRGQVITARQGSLRLPNHYAPLTGQAITSRTSGISAFSEAYPAVPSPIGVSTTYARTEQITVTPGTNTTMSFYTDIVFLGNGNFTTGGSGTSSVFIPWTSYLSDIARSEYEFNVTLTTAPSGLVTTFFGPATLGTWFSISPFSEMGYRLTTIHSVIYGTPIALQTIALNVQIRPVATSANRGNPFYERNYTITIVQGPQAPAVPQVSISDTDVVVEKGTMQNISATITYHNDGMVSYSTGQSTWVAGAPVPISVSGEYEIRATFVLGGYAKGTNYSGSPVGSWIRLSSTVSWSVNANSVFEANGVSRVLFIEIRSVSSGIVLDSATVKLVILLGTISAPYNDP